MIVLKENERLYATSWQYNSARILTRLAQLITAQGGKVKPLYPAVISDRNLEEVCTATQRRIESSYNAGPTSHPKERETQIFNLQSELSRLELNGACSYDGKPLILLEQAYCSYDCYHGIAQYVATAICPNEIAKDFTAPCYVVTWPIIRPSAENEEDACDWSAPNGLTPHGEYDLERRYYY